jgi:hypothetical protein
MNPSIKQVVVVIWLLILPVHWGLGQAPNTVQSPLSVLERQAEDGNIEAQAKLGSKYLFGDGVPKDLALAFKWSYRAAIAGNSLAARNVAKAYLSGLGISQNKQAAFEWCWIAANRDDANAQGALAAFYRNGEAVGKDIALAYAWALIRENAGDKRILPLFNALEQNLIEDQKSEAIALATAWSKNKVHVMPIHSRWYFNHLPQAENEQVKPRVLPRPTGSCSSGHWISDNIDDGKYIKLDDGSLWEVNVVDTVDSALWLEMDDITVCNGKLINTDDKESVEARRIN